MAVTADGTYGGADVTGVTFTVVEAWRREKPRQSEDFLQYDVEVVLLDGVTVVNIPSWQNVRVDDPDSSLSAGVPTAQAEEHMKARLSASGWTNITDV